MGSPQLAMVWGNCQAAPLADLLRAPLAAGGYEIVDVPAVYLAGPDEIERVHRLVREAALLISQPVREEYRFGGCGTQALAAELPTAGRLLRIPSAFHTGPFPYLVHAHGSDGARVDAPQTDYHDLRAVAAASRGLGVTAAMSWWPVPSVDDVRAEDADSRERLRRRGAGLDVRVDDLLGVPDSLWSMNHPTNRVLAQLARRIVAVLGLDAPVVAPQREYLGQRRAPVEPAVAMALGWPASAARLTWVVDGTTLDPSDVLAAHLELYAARPDVVTDVVTRYADRIAHLPGHRAY